MCGTPPLSALLNHKFRHFYALASKELNLEKNKLPQQKPSGYPGLRRSIAEAQIDEVFLHDDRALHVGVLVCKMWYQREMARHLMNAKELPSSLMNFAGLLQGLAFCV